MHKEMRNDDNLELTTEEASALASLPREMPVGDLLEARVMRALRNEGHFGSASVRTRRGLSVVWKIAAAIALFASGVAAGRYVLVSRTNQSASITAPDSLIQDRTAGVPRNAQRPVPHNETVVAEREMWL
jgi:hypothetical protein